MLGNEKNVPSVSSLLRCHFSYLSVDHSKHGTPQLYYNYGLKDSCLDFNVVLSVTLEYYTLQTELFTTLPAGRIAGRGLYV